jgi:hypothetical protein
MRAKELAKGPAPSAQTAARSVVCQDCGARDKGVSSYSVMRCETILCHHASKFGLVGPSRPSNARDLSLTAIVSENFFLQSLPFLRFSFLFSIFFDTIHTNQHNSTDHNTSKGRGTEWCYICVVILLYMCPHTAVSSYCYMCPHTTIYVSSYCYICVVILLCMCPHTATYVSPCCYICVLILIYMCCLVLRDLNFF